MTTASKISPSTLSDSSLNEKTGTVKEDGSLVLKLYYDRNVYTAKFVAINPNTEQLEVYYQKRPIDMARSSAFRR
ncbi:hypothetical protein [Paenibacillus sp. YIM B09110]|uniref:hypothetical protein n=1 Tax=Paenibacillus sp. YIM B09110 TaxID=3126102 RepID=UPI00301E39AB